MNGQHDNEVADVLDFGATTARAVGELVGGPWGVIAGKTAGRLLNVAANALRNGVSSEHMEEAIKRLKPLDFATSRAENDRRAAELPEKP